MSKLFLFAVIALVIYYEWDFVAVALTPIIDIIVCILFILAMLVVLVCEIALIVIAPVALLLGIDSRMWHVDITKKSMSLFGSEKWI